MTSSVIGNDGQLIKQADPTTGKEQLIFVPSLNPRTGKEIPVSIFKLSRLLGLYVIGMQRMGKSGLFETLIDQDIRQGIGVCVLDPHGELIDHVIARLPKNREQDVILLDITDMFYFFGLPLLDCADLQNELSIAKTRSQFLHVFEKAFGITEDNPTMYTLLSNIAYTLIANPGYTMIDIRLLLTNKTCRETLLQNVKPQVRDYWHDHYDQLSKEDQRKESFYILNKLNDFENAPLRYIVGQSRSNIDLQEFMDEGKILLVKLDRQLEQATKLIGSILVALILNASESRKTNKLFNLYADEFQNFATEDFAILLEQAPKRGVGVTMAHQNRSQLELSDEQADKNLKDRTLNVGNLLVFRVPTDAHALAGQFDTTPIPSLNQTQQKPKFAITSDPVGWFRQGHRHSNPRVNELVEKYLQPLLEEERKYKDEYKSQVFPYYAQLDKMNKFLKYAMDGQQLHSSKQLKDTLGSLIQDMVGGEKPFVTSFSQLYQDFISPLVHLGYAPYVKTPDFKMPYQMLCNDVEREGAKPSPDWVSGLFCFVPLHNIRYGVQFQIETRETLTNELINYFLLQLFQAAMATFPCHNPMVEKKIRNLVRSLHPEFKQHPMTTQEILQETIFHTQFDYLANRGYEEQLQSEAKRQALIDNIERHAYGRAVRIDPKLLEPAPSSPILSQYEEYKSKHLKKLFLEGLQDTDPVMVDRKDKAQQLVTNALLRTQQCICEWDELATLLAADPMKLPTGEYEDVPVPRTFADMQNEIASKLVKLPKYTAWVKLSDTNGDVVEHIITTLKPEKGLYGKALQERIDRIQANNRTPAKPGTLPYCRTRQDVEDEITKRQNQCSQSQQQPPPPPPQSRRRKLKKCQACGGENTETATVCSQCGKPL